ncbi:hypothetical protein PENTCL1PPCAC_12703, partial [Pristionchus entomophagus]
FMSFISMNLLVKCISVACKEHQYHSMLTYMSFANEESLSNFYEDCPIEINNEFTIEISRKNRKRTSCMTKSQFLKVKPTVDEFIALFGLSIWNDYTSSLSSELSEIASKNRTMIIEELHK